MAFDTSEQAAESLQRVRAHYTRHSRAVREIAREHLYSDRVLPGCFGRRAPVESVTWWTSLGPHVGGAFLGLSRPSTR
jgi:hypothetical protein